MGYYLRTFLVLSFSTMLGYSPFCLAAETREVDYRSSAALVEQSAELVRASTNSLSSRPSSRRLKLVVRKKSSLKGKRASVFKKSFRRVASNLGLWRGYVKGNGHIHLRLNILRHGAVESTRYIGSVQMRQNEKATTFKFKAPLPKGQGWSWDISAKSL